MDATGRPLHVSQGDFERRPESMWPLPFHPESKARLLWDMFRIAAVTFDATAIPLVVMVLPEGSALQVLSIIVLLFWVVDIVVMFLSAVSVGDEHYLQRWLLLDSVLVLPEFVLWLQGSYQAGAVVARPFQLARCLRLLRLFKVGALVEGHAKRMDSMRALYTMQFLQVMFVFFLVNHVFACIWCCTSRQENDGRFEAGRGSDLLFYSRWWIHERVKTTWVRRLRFWN